jgi:acetylornithine deacetylase/succinyl-diaminopimelate desuccinylase-like protein
MLINSDRFKQDFDTLAQIGAAGNGGAHRPALSEAHLAARAWLLARAAEAGLVPSRDGLSHSPQEFTEWDACVNGANVLLRAALNLASDD